MFSECVSQLPRAQTCSENAPLSDNFFPFFFLKKNPKKTTEKAKPIHSLLGLLVWLGLSYTKKLKCKTMHVVVRISACFTGCISEGILTISPVFKSKGFLMQGILVISSSTLVAAGTGNFVNK